MRRYVIKNVPGSSYRALITVLTNATTFVFAHPDKAEREAEQALAHVQAFLPQRVKEEHRKNNKDDYEHSMARLRLKWDRVNFVILKENLWDHVKDAPPIGPAVRTLVEAVKTVIDDLDVAFRKAPPLKGDREEIAVVDPIIPEALETSEGGVPENVDYDELIS